MKNLDIKSIRCMTVRLVLSAVLVISIILLRSPGFCAEQQDPQLMNGWPQSVGEKLKGGPVCADMDGDGDNEIFAIGKDGKACLWGHDGQLIWQLEGSQGSDISGSGVINNASPRRRRRPGGSAEGAVGRNLSDPVIADVNGDGDKEIIFTGTDSNFERRVYILNHDKTLYSDFRILTKEALSDVPIAPIIVDDLTGDGKNEIIVMLRDITWSYGVVSVFNPRGYQLTGWPFRLEMDEGRYLPLYGGMSLGDIDGNGSKELVVTMSEASSSENACSVFVLGPDGSRIANWRFATDSPEAGMPSIGDVDGDDQGRMEIFFGLNTRVYGFDLAGNALDGWPKETGARVSNEIVLADIDDNADLEVIFTTSASEIHIYHHDGTPFSLSPDDWPKTMPAGTGTVSKLFSSISVGDIDGDEAVDIVAACPSTSDIYAYDISGTLLTGFPKDTEASGSTIVCRPAQLTDIDLDRDIDIVAADIVSGTVYVWNMGEDYDLEFIEWPELRHDPGNTGAYVPLVLSNHRPVITQMADAAYVIGETVNLQVPASDPDPADTTLYYYQTGLPPEVDLGLTTGTLIWDTTNAQARAYPVTFTVADRPENDPDGDRQVSVEMSMTITLDEENHIPVMSTIEDFTGNNAINEEEPFSIPLTADDADAGDTLTYSMDIDLSGATVTAVDSRTGRFDWTPSFEQGVDTPYNIIFSVSDGRGGIDTEAVAIEVNNVNQPPIFSPEIPQDLQLPVDENRELEFLMYGADNDMEPLYFGIEVENPQDFPVTDAGSLVTTLSDHEGRFAWTPGGSDAGTYTVTFTVTDRDPAVNHPDRQIATSPVITINVADSSTAPAAPTGLAAIAPPLTERRIDLSWIVRSDNADHFIIERSPTEDGQFTAIYTTGSNINGYTDNSGLTPETTYYYKVKAVNQEGSSGYTDPAHATTNPDRPATPAPLVAPTVSYDQIILEWANVANETGYQIERSLTGEEDSFVHIATTAADGNGYLDLERSPATVYYYRVRAVNLGGYSDYTLTLTVITAPETPTATASTTARGITVTWAAVTGATGYRLQRGTSTSEASFDYTTSFPETETSHYDDQMANAGTYYYRVCVIRPQPIGESPYSAPASAVTIPDAPANLTLAAMTTERGITASWTGSTGATGYKLERGTSADPGSFTLAASLLAGVVTHNDTSMTTPGTYYYRVCATNSAGDSPYTDPADPSANAVTIPDAQTGLIAVANDNDIALSWTNPAGNNANNFVIQRGTSADESSFSDIVVNPPIPSNITTYNDTGLTAGTTYHYRVRAENDSGRSLYSNTASAATNPSAPAAPTTLSAVAPEGSQGRIDLSWADNSDNEDNFIVERGPTQDEPFVGIYTSIPNVIGYSDTGLSADTIYYYRVHAVNLGGPSAYTSVASATTNPDLPAVPTGLTATAMTAERGITLRWDVVPNVTGYKLQRGTSAEESSFSEIASFASNITAYNDVTMLNAGTYYYKVCSLDSNVHSAYSDPVNAATIPDLPANLTATGGNNITVSWAHNSTNNAENYTLQRRPDTSGENSFGTISTNSVSPNEYTSYSYSDTAVTGGATYDYRVRFSNQSGDSNYTAPVSAMADPQPPTTYSLSVTAVNGSVAVADAQGAALQPPYNDIAENTVLTLTATPDTGYSFTGWTGATPVQGHPEQATVTMDNNKEVTAAFTGGQANNPPIINTIQGRTVTQPPDAPLSFNATESQLLELQLSASDPDTGDTFTYSIDMQATPAPPAGISANSINAQTGLFGWTPASDQGGMSYAITFVATDSHNATGTANVVISVVDVPTDYQVSVTAVNGTVTVTNLTAEPDAVLTPPCMVAENTSISFTADPADNYIFEKWSIAGAPDESANPYIVNNLAGNIDITANFTPAGQGPYTITLSYDYGSVTGTVTDSQGTRDLAPYGPYTVEAGSSVTLNAVPAAGCEFTEWSGDASGATTQVTLSNLDSNKRVTAKFAIAGDLINSKVSGKIAVNLGNVRDYAVAVPFVNVIKGFRRWQIPTEFDNEIPDGDRTANNYPMIDADAINFLDDYPDGDYLLSYEGTGDIAASGIGRLKGDLVKTGDLTTGTITVDRSLYSGQYLLLEARNLLDRNDPLNNLKLLMPGYGHDTTAVFRPRFQEVIHPFSGLRLMQTLENIGSSQKDWDDRRKPDDFSYATYERTPPRGYKYESIPWELVIALANETGKDIWICIPDLATDEYVEALADLLLHPENGLDFAGIAEIREQDGIPVEDVFKIRIEYSNEVWNTDGRYLAFYRARDLADDANNPLLQGVGDEMSRWVRVFSMCGYLSAHVMKIMNDKFEAAGKSSHLRTVFGGQAVMPYYAEKALDFVDLLINQPGLFTNQEYPAEFAGLTGVSDVFDEYTIAPYMDARNIVEFETVTIGEEVIAVDLDRVFEEMLLYTEEGYVDRYSAIDRHSAYSHVVSLADNPSGAPVPGAPRDLSAAAVSDTQIDLTWRNQLGETGFEIERGTAQAGPFTLIHTTERDGTAYSDTGLTLGATYYYRVRAITTGRSDKLGIREEIRRNIAFASGYGLGLVAYEGGQHLEAASYPSNPELKLLAQYDRRMYEVYKRYFTAWDELGGGQFYHYALASEYNNWGAFALFEDLDQDLSLPLLEDGDITDATDPATLIKTTAPKWLAVMELINAEGGGGGGQPPTGYTLTINVSPANSGTVTVDRQHNNDVNIPRVTANALSGYEFTGWTVVSGTPQINGVAGSPNIIDVTLSGAAAIQADFTQDQPPTEYTLTINVDPLNSGTVTGAGTYTSNDNPVNITAAANTGYQFANWEVISGGPQIGSTTAATTTATLSADAVIRANFAQDQPPTEHSLTTEVSPANSGTISIVRPYQNNANVAELTATLTPQSGYQLTSWDVISGTPQIASSTPTPHIIVVTLSGDATIRATFNKPPVIDTIQGQAVTQPPDAPLSFNATEGQQLELQVSASDPDTGDTFTYSIDMQATPAPPAGISANSINAQTGLFGWTPASDQGGMSYAITFVATDSHNATGTANVVISVADVPADYQITIPVPENGTVAVTDAVTGADIPRATPSDPYIVADGTSIILDARPATDYSFTGWGDGLTGTQDPYPLTVRGNMSITASFTETPPPDLPSAGKIGVNLSPITDFTIGHPFINIAKGLRAWQLPGRYIGELPEDDLTGNDYPKVDAHTIHYMKGYPDGDYLLSYEGTGEIDAGSMGTRNGPLVTADGVTTGVITIDREGTGRNILAIYARNVDSSDPISNLKIIMPHHEAGKEYGPNDIFREEFLDALQPFTSLRFMDWLQTNRSWHTNWADRTHMDDFSYSSGGKKTLTTVIGGDEREYTSNRFGGVPWEIVAALANQTGKDIWINIPSLATDDYLRNLAALLRSELDFERIAQIRQQNGIPDEEVFTIRVEYSNEVWNTQLFFQGNKIKEMAETHPILELTNEDREYDKVKEANSRFRALMCYITAHAMKIMKDEFKGDGTTAKPDLSEHIRAVYGGRSASVTMVGIGFGYIDMLINEPGLFVNQEYPQEFASFADGTPITQVSDIFDDYAIAAYNNPSRVSEVDSVIIDGVLVKSNMDSLFDEMQHLAEDGYVDRVTLGYSGYSNIACATDSSMPPPEDPVLGSPSDLEATLISGTQIDLSWRDVAGDTGYEIERGTNLAGPFAKVGESNRSTAAYSDTEVTSGTDYYYRVRAIRINTNDTAYSNIACPTDSSLPLGYPLPGALWNGGTWGLKATAVSGSQIDLSWKDVASNLNLWVDPPTDSVTYLIERSTSLEGPFTLIYRSSREELDLTTYSDTEITPGVTYYYRVQPKRFVNKLDGLRVNLREIKEFLGPYGIKLTAYEGGQHLEASQRNPANRNLKLLAQYDRRMQETYKKWFNAWFEEGGDLFCHFHLVSEYDNYGSWGLFEGFDQDRELPLRDISDTDNPEDLIKTTAPKWLAIKEFLYPEGEDNQPQPPTEHTLTTSVSQANRGTVTVTNLTAEPDAVLMLPCLVADGTRISFTAIPGDDCIFEKWSIANAPDEFDNPYIINSMTASISITANFGRTTNSQPQFTSPQNGQVFPGTVGQTLTINLSGTDPDGDSTHINAGPSQLGAEIPVVNWQNMLTDNGNGTAEFVWDNPVAAGDYYVQFAVIDRPLGSDGSYPTQMQHALIDVGISIPEPTEPPEVPESLSATASYTAHAIDLTWATAPGATGYRVQRARSADGTAAPAESAYAIITDPPVTGSSYNDTGMPHAGTYFYKVCAANSIGDSAYTAAVSAMTIPDAPTNLRARQAGDGITLFWDDTSFDNNSTNNARWAYVFRSPYSDSNDSFGSAGMFHAAEHYRHDQYNNNNLYTGLTGGTTYTYRVRLGNATGVSGFTNDATATAGSNFPPRPLNPRISFYSQDRIDFEWDDVDGETRYEVQRSEHSGGLESSFSTITSDPHLSADTTLYSDTNGGNGFTPGVTYYYRVGAVGPGGNSPYSYIPVATPGCSLSVIVDPANSGTVAVTSSQQSYLPPFDSIPVNTEITLRATALTGYNFTGWTGATPVLGHPERATITMDRNRQVTADFAADSGQPPPSNQAIFIDHYCTDLSSVPDVWIDQARAQFKIWYSRTSHGKQITDAMRAIQDAANAAGVETPFRFNETSSGGALSLQEANDDLGDETNPDPPAWETATRNLLGPPANPISDINVIMWSWGDGVSHNTVEGIDNYLTAMNRLETDYPNVTFIYMTGHLDGSGTVLPDGNLHQRNNQIRQYCLANNKILYDFADIESFDPSGNEFRSRFANDRTYYDSNGDGINSNHHPDASWAVEWLNTGTNSSLITTDYNAFNSDRRLLIPPMQENTAHTHYLSATQKGRAFWWMMARLAGWSGE